MKLIGIPVSPFVRKVILVLEEHGIDFENDPSVSPLSVPEGYREKYHPLGKIPALEDGDFCLADSSAIIAYINDKFPEKEIFSKDIQTKAKSLWIEEYCDTKVAGELTGVIFFQRIVRGKIMKQEYDEGLVNNAIENSAPPIFDYLSSVLGDQQYLLGDTYSTADMALLSQLVALSYGGFHIDSMQWPKLAAYVDNLKSLPSVQRVLSAEQEILAEFV
ncbi:MAG: glutathione S-transferase family protein [Candidatus Cloacimonetes bacterium]|nr:glutathione S-transferase family protein [Candidatus Cloacimonadota bacterium]